MVRFVLLLLAALVLVGMPSEAVEHVLGEAVEARDDCCPETPDAAGDCCDWDLGACCAAHVVAALPRSEPLPAVERAVPPPEQHPVVPLHLLLPRDNGPPETPPPIA